MGNRPIPASHEEARRNALLNAISGEVERESLRFTALCMDRLLQHAKPEAGDKILDLASGAGPLALAASQAVGPAGRAVAIDSAADPLVRPDCACIQAEHLAEVTAPAGADGLWLDAAVLCAHGRVPVPGG